MSYRGRLTEAARESIRAGGPNLSRTAWMLDAEQVNGLVVDDVDVRVGSPTEYLIVHCHAPDTTTEPDGVMTFDITLDQATAMQLLFASQLDETRLPTTHTRAPVEPPDTNPPLVTGVGDGVPTRGVQITVDSVFPRGHSER